MHHYVSTTLGPSFADPPTAKLSDVFNDSSPTTPLVLTVAQGADATSELAAFAVTQGRAVGQGLQLLSLGQGQGPVAEALVRVAMRNGDWVCLQVSLRVIALALWVCWGLCSSEKTHESLSWIMRVGWGGREGRKGGQVHVFATAHGDIALQDRVGGTRHTNHPRAAKSHQPMQTRNFTMQLQSGLAHHKPRGQNP